MKKILLFLLFIVSLPAFCQKVAIVNGGKDPSVFPKSSAFIIKTLKKDAVVRKAQFEVLEGYDKLSSLKVSDYKAVIIVNANLPSGL